MMKGIITRIGVNADLCRAFPHKSMDSIKALRKNEEYLLLRSGLKGQGREALPAEPPGSPIRDFGIEANKERLHQNTFTMSICTLQQSQQY